MGENEHSIDRLLMTSKKGAGSPYAVLGILI